MEESSGSAVTGGDPEGATVAVSRRRDGAVSARAEAFTAGDAVGRYVLLRELGAGGMGVVFEARDPDLDRSIAVKVLRDARSGSAHARLLREAQALAGLTHENVVDVYDVGEHDGNVFIAMQYVAGQDLKSWLRERARTTAETLDTFIQAGRGLVAAHGIGIIHRDFKPDNVLVGDDGRVHVTDFGLAHRRPTPGSTSTNDGDLEAFDADPGPSDDKLTRAGLVMGTPAYMSPEQHRGQETDARTDQYSFCVALFEALAGERPFRGMGSRGLLRAKMAGPPRWPPDANVRPHLRAAVERGMAPEPAGRFASMDELLERLGARSSRRGWWLGLAVAGIAGGGLAFVLSDDGPAAGCDTDARLFAVWNQGRRDELAARFESSAVSYAGTTWRRTAPLLEAYAASWRDAYQNTCARLRADPAAAALDGHMQCLSSRLHALESLVDVLDAGDRSVIEHAVSATSRLPAISACLLGDPAYTDPTPADATLAGQVAAVRRRVVRATVLRDAGQFDAALAEATRAHTDAEVLAWRPLLAETGACLGTSYERTGEYARAVEQLERSWLDAVATGHDGAAVHASTELVFVLGFQMQRLDEAQQWARHAESALGPLGHRPVAQARLDNSMGAVLSGLGDHEAAAARFAQAEALFAEGLGPGHPDIATALHNLAAAQVALGRYAEAEASVRRALPVFAESLGPEHPDTANAMDLLGNALQRQGRLDEAAEVADKALEMRIAILSSDHPDVARSYNNLGSLYEARGDDVRALSHYRKALAVFERVMGESSMYAAAARINVAAVLVRTGDIDTAIRALDESGATFERELPAEHAYRVHRLVVLGQAELARGRAPEALAAAEEVRMSCDAMALEPGLCGMGRFVRAAARWELGKKEGAVAEARRALGELQRGATAETADIMRVQTWLAVRDAGEPR